MTEISRKDFSVMYEKGLETFKTLKSIGITHDEYLIMAVLQDALKGFSVVPDVVEDEKLTSTTYPFKFDEGDKLKTRIGNIVTILDSGRYDDGVPSYCYEFERDGSTMISKASIVEAWELHHKNGFKHPVGTRLKTSFDHAVTVTGYDEQYYLIRFDGYTEPEKRVTQYVDKWPEISD